MIETVKRGKCMYHSTLFQKNGHTYKATSAAIIGAGVPPYGKTQIVKLEKKECVYYDEHPCHEAGASMLIKAITEFMGWVG